MCENKTPAEPEPGFYETRHMIAITESLRRELEEVKRENAVLRNMIRSLLDKTPGTGDVPGDHPNPTMKGRFLGSGPRRKV